VGRAQLAPGFSCGFGCFMLVCAMLCMPSWEGSEHLLLPLLTAWPAVAASPAGWSELAGDVGSAEGSVVTALVASKLLLPADLPPRETGSPHCCSRPAASTRSHTPPVLMCLLPAAGDGHHELTAAALQFICAELQWCHLPKGWRRWRRSGSGCGGSRLKSMRSRLTDPSCAPARRSTSRQGGAGRGGRDGAGQGSTGRNWAGQGGTGRGSRTPSGCAGSSCLLLAG
jgi:hypothetical protein